MSTAAGRPPQRRAPAGRAAYALAGFAATVAGLGAGHLVAGYVAPEASPALAVGGFVVDHVPGWLKEAVIQTFGTADKPVLLVCVTVVTVILGSAAGLVERRRRGLGAWVLLALVALAGMAAATHRAAATYAVLPSVVSGLVGLVVFTWLVRRLGPPGDAVPPAMAPSRRGFFVTSGAAVLGGVAAGVVGESVARAGTIPQVPIALPAPSVALPPLARGLDAAIPGLSPFRTPTADFYRIDTALVIPRVDASSWRLTIDGLVDAPYELSYAELLAMPMIETDITLNCVSNPVAGPYIGSTRWLGVRTRDVLARAGIRPGADQILSTSVDGMTISTPVTALTDGRDAILAVAMDGRPLPTVHGFPVRMVTPGLYGYVGATKWLSRLTATTFAAAPAYWTERGWAEQAQVLTQSRIDVPRAGARVDVGTVVVAGVAWSQADGGISRVEVRIDDGPWLPATLGPDAGMTYWRQWRFDWPATSGTHRVTARATDGHGQVQTDKVADPFPSGATGLETIEVQVG